MELVGDELIASLEVRVQAEIRDEQRGWGMLRQATADQWKQAESNRALGYNGLAVRTVRRHAQKRREKEEQDAITRKGCG